MSAGILGVGTDICAVERIAQQVHTYGDKWPERIFTDAERAVCARRADGISAYARQFAAKEAVLKALGTGLAQGVAWHDIEILRDEAGAPICRLTGQAHEVAHRKAIAIAGAQANYTMHVSISDEKTMAVAFAILSIAL